MYINSSCQGGTPGVVADPILFAFRFYFLFDFVLFAPSLYFSSSYIAVALLVDYDDVCFLFLFLFFAFTTVVAEVEVVATWSEYPVPSCWEVEPTIPVAESGPPPSTRSRGPPG